MKFISRVEGDFHVYGHGIDKSYVKHNGKLVAEEECKGYVYAKARLKLAEGDIIEVPDSVTISEHQEIYTGLLNGFPIPEFKVNFDIGENFGNVEPIEDKLCEQPFIESVKYQWPLEVVDD